MVFSSQDSVASCLCNLHPGLAGKWAYLFWECETFSEQLPSLDKVIRLNFIPAIPGHAGSDIEWVFLALPAKMGALGLQNVASDAELFYLWSRSVLPGHWLIACSAGMKDWWRRSWKFNAMHSRPSRGPMLAGWPWMNFLYWQRSNCFHRWRG